MEEDPDQQPPLKRKRVTIACESCRVKKVKCDNRRPVCGRCEGYGFTCAWRPSKRAQSDGASHEGPSPTDPPDAALGGYEALIHHLCADLPREALEDVQHLLSRIHDRVTESRMREAESRSSGQEDSTGPSAACSPTSRYLGEGSDIHFLNLASQTLKAAESQNYGTPNGGHRPVAMDAMEMYDQDARSTPLLNVGRWILTLPDAIVGKDYLAVYFSTIHIAYPFVPRQSLESRYRRLLSAPSTHENVNDEGLTSTWLSLIYGVLSISVYYDTFSLNSQTTERLHQECFHRSILLTDFTRLESSITQVSALLAQCFYLLATSKTDRCWVTLGIAVRLAQCLGLHADHRDVGFAPLSALPASGLPLPGQLEIQRRTWYSLYVLDRLVALQLGRPPATLEEDFHVPRPKRLNDCAVDQYDWEGQDLLPPEANGASNGDYFLSVIEFSGIVGRVLRLLNRPRQQLGNYLVTTTTYDGELMTWKRGLPRHLRFDIGHVFNNKLIVFKRQRNMLAVKYYHLRALLHRPYLRLGVEDRLVAEAVSKDQLEHVYRCRRVCISEARRTAQLFHHVQDVTEIVHDYPWWQIISCIVCASSILTVAHAFPQLSATAGEFDTLPDEVETCLDVLESLSGHSDGAKSAACMVRRLRDLSLAVAERRGFEDQSDKTPSSFPNSIPETDPRGPIPELLPQMNSSMNTSPNGLEVVALSGYTGSEPWEARLMYSDFAPSSFESLAWSNQVFNSMSENSGVAQPYIQTQGAAEIRAEEDF